MVSVRLPCWLLQAFALITRSDDDYIKVVFIAPREESRDVVI